MYGPPPIMQAFSPDQHELFRVNVSGLFTGLPHSGALALMEPARIAPHKLAGYAMSRFFAQAGDAPVNSCVISRSGIAKQGSLSFSPRERSYPACIGYGRYSHSVANTFQQIRTSLLAKATTATLRWRLASMPRSHSPSRERSRFMLTNNACAP